MPKIKVKGQTVQTGKLGQTRTRTDRCYQVHYLPASRSIIKCTHMHRLRYSAIPCLLSVCFNDSIHGRCASYFVNIGWRFTLGSNVCRTWSTSLMYCIIRTNGWTIRKGLRRTIVCTCPWNYLHKPPDWPRTIEIAWVDLGHPYPGSYKQEIPANRGQKVRSRSTRAPQSCTAITDTHTNRPSDQGAHALSTKKI